MRRPRNKPKRRPKNLRDREMASIINKISPVDWKKLERDTTAFILGRALLSFADKK